MGPVEYLGVRIYFLIFNTSYNNFWLWTLVQPITGTITTTILIVSLIQIKLGDLPQITLGQAMLILVPQAWDKQL